MSLPTCQVMLETSRQQCQNAAWASNDGIDYCRLHFSYMISKNADAGIPLINPTTYNEDDQADLDALVKMHDEGEESNNIA